MQKKREENHNKQQRLFKKQKQKEVEFICMQAYKKINIREKKKNE